MGQKEEKNGFSVVPVLLCLFLILSSFAKVVEKENQTNCCFFMLTDKVASLSGAVANFSFQVDELAVCNDTNRCHH